MGQIQNALNQIFTSALGASLAAQHSPYAKYKAAYNTARAKADEALSTYETIQEVPPGLEEYGDIKKLPGRENLQQKRDLLEYAEQLETAHNEWLQAEDAVREVDIVYGSRGKRQAAIKQRGIDRHEQLIEGKKSPEEMTIQRLQEAYRHRQEIESAVPARKKLIDQIKPETIVERPTETIVKKPKQTIVETGRPGVMDRGRTLPETRDRSIETEAVSYRNPGSTLDKPESITHKGGK